MICKYATIHSEFNACAIGLYGGKPSHGTCKLCIENKQNNEAYAKELFEKQEKTHPSSDKGISGCCDSALNYR